MSTTYDFLGRGLALPLAPDDTGRLPLAAGPARVRQAIYTILDTEPGERIMLPRFGCGLRRFLMQPNNSATRAQIEREVSDSLKRWEPRIAVGEVTVEAGEDAALVLIQVRYVHVHDNRPDNFVYPFYLE